MDPYYNRPEVSNSDLVELKKHFMPRMQIGDIQAAYRFGTLVDAIITEPEKLDFFNRTIDDYSYSAEEIEIANLMKRAYLKDEYCRSSHRLAVFQKVFAHPVQLEHEGFEFSLAMRCKFDRWFPAIGAGDDLKSTACTTQKQFEEAIRYFDYDQQRAVYMTLSGSKRDMLIGISKENFKIFKVPITRDSELFKTGMQKFQDNAFKYWTLFGDLKLTA